MRALIAVLSLSTGCAYLRPVTLDTLHLATSRPCAQGPLRIETTALGSRWGEWYSLEIVTQRATKGSVRWVVGSEKEPPRGWVTHHEVPDRGSTTQVVDTIFHHEQCAERPAYLVELPQQPIAPPVVVTAQPSPTVVVTEPAPSPLPVPDVSQVQLVETGSSVSGSNKANIFHWTSRNESKDAPPPLASGAPVVIEIWSETPNDYRGATFVFTRGPMEPNVSEQEWLAELDKREIDKKKAFDEESARDAERRRLAEIEARRVAAIHTAEARKEQDLRKRHAEELARRPVPVKTDEQRRYEESRRATYANGLTAPSSADPAYVDERRREFERRQARAAAEAEELRRFREERQRRWEEYEANRPRPRPSPTTPPPPPPPQNVGNPPAPYVVWIDGYYEWTGTTWAWLEGWWKVIESERARFEAMAMTPPPPPRVEQRPTCPVPAGEWRTGGWVWNLEAWIWLPGVWISTQPPVHPAGPAKP